jgi:hypothetical protein
MYFLTTQTAYSPSPSWFARCTLWTASAGQFHLSEISGLRTWRNYPFRTIRSIVR